MIQFLRNHVFHNFGLKLLSLAIAVLLWLAVVRDPSSEMVLRIPVQFNRIPPNLEFTSEHVPEAEIRVRGPERILRNLDSNEVNAPLDLSKATPGEHTYNIDPRSVRVPHNVEVVQVIPAQFRIAFDRQVTKMIPVRPRVIGSLATGVQLVPEEVAAQPAEVAVTGPEKRVNQLDAVLTDPVDATGVVGRGTFTTNVFVPDPLVQLVHPGPVQVTVVTEKADKRVDSKATKH